MVSISGYDESLSVVPALKFYQYDASGDDKRFTSLAITALKYERVRGPSLSENLPELFYRPKAMDHKLRTTQQ